jgi:metallo-beta-lactamase class B
MRHLAFALGVVLLTSWSAAQAIAQSAKAQAHVAAARAAAYEPGQDLTQAFSSCNEPKSALAPGPPSGTEQVKSIPPSSEWYTDPQKVFDNLYYVGGNRKFNHNAWAVTTSEGIILIDGGIYYTAEELVVGGLKKLGLDPAHVKYVIVTEGEPEFYGAAKLLQDRYRSHVLLSEAEWNVIAKNTTPAQYKPRKDMVVTDGQKLTLGDVTVTLYITTGHGPGTVSLIVSPIKDGNQQHVASMFGGRGFGGPELTHGVQYFPTVIEGISKWGASAKRFRTIAENAGADVFLAKHDGWDKTLDKLNALKFRQPGGPHPFVSKSAVLRYQTILSECMDAQLAWRSGR